MWCGNRNHPPAEQILPLLLNPPLHSVCIVDHPTQRNVWIIGGLMFVEADVHINDKCRIISDRQGYTFVQPYHLHLLRLGKIRSVQGIVHLQGIPFVFHEHGKHITFVLSVFAHKYSFLWRPKRNSLYPLARSPAIWLFKHGFLYRFDR